MQYELKSKLKRESVITKGKQRNLFGGCKCSHEVMDPLTLFNEFSNRIFWDLICMDPLTLFDEFYHGRLDIALFNYGLLFILSEVKGADKLIH
jgi:hypothetical protein